MNTNGEEKQYRAEVRDLKKNRRQIAKTHALWIRERQRVIRDLNRELVKGDKAVARSHQKIDRRIAILEGRIA